MTATGYTGGGGGGAVSSVFGRTGVVTAQNGDYTPGQVGADPAGTAAGLVSTEATTRSGADTTLQTNITNEATARTTADNLRVLKAGDTMTGALVLPADPTLPLQAATKQYVDASGGGGGIVVRDAFYTGGHISLSVGSSWTLVGPTIALPAAVGDWVELIPMFMKTATTTSFLDIAVIVSAAAVRYASSNAAAPKLEGCPWYYVQPSSFEIVPGPFGFTVASGDLSGGNVTFQLAAKGSAGQIFADNDYPFRWIAKNFGTAS